jgi:hypothetical protein
LAAMNALTCAVVSAEGALFSVRFSVEGEVALPLAVMGDETAGWTLTQRPPKRPPTPVFTVVFWPLPTVRLYAPFRSLKTAPPTAPVARTSGIGIATGGGAGWSPRPGPAPGSPSR